MQDSRRHGMTVGVQGKAGPFASPSILTLQAQSVIFTLSSELQTQLPGTA